MNTCYLGLGSNQKHPERQLRRVFKELKSIPRTYVTSTSALHWTKAWGVQSQQKFCNAVAEINTSLKPIDLLKYCQKIEKKHLRTRKRHWGPRTLDIDILLYENRTIRSKLLSVPHPYLMDRDFALKPILEINPMVFEQNFHLLNY